MSEHKAAEAWFKDTPNTCFFIHGSWIFPYGWFTLEQLGNG
jgi:hypothetical protein